MAGWEGEHLRGAGAAVSAGAQTPAWDGHLRERIPEERTPAGADTCAGWTPAAVRHLRGRGGRGMQVDGHLRAGGSAAPDVLGLCWDLGPHLLCARPRPLAGVGVCALGGGGTLTDTCDPEAAASAAAPASRRPSCLARPGASAHHALPGLRLLSAQSLLTRRPHLAPQSPPSRNPPRPADLCSPLAPSPLRPALPRALPTPRSRPKRPVDPRGDSINVPGTLAALGIPQRAK